jgi:electron transfer flavoprotein alpha subunit
MTNVLVLAEQRGGQLNPHSIETVVAGQKLAAALGVDMDIGLLGGNVDTAASELAGAKANRLFTVSDPALELYTAEASVAAARVLVDELKPQYVLFPHTYLVRDYAPRLAAGFRRVLISDCVDFRLDDGDAIFVRQLFQGKVNADIRATGDHPHFVSFQAGAFRPDEFERGAVDTQSMNAGLDAAALSTRAEEPVHELSGGVDLTSAEIIVSVGRGIQSEDNVELARKLAAALNAEVGASRPVCDAGWMTSDHQIGSSGQSVAPKLYLALGVSGSIQHMVGCKGSKTIAAINTDSSAPIFKAAQYGIVGDVLEVVPALLEELGRDG